MNNPNPLTKEQINQRHMNNGVVITDPATAYISAEALIGSGTVIKPNTTIEGSVTIGGNCTIGPNSVISGSRIGDDTTVLMSVVNDAVIGSNTTVGPFAYLRPGSEIGDHVKVGDFVEIKNSVIGDGTKISHLTYVGDSDVGSGVNFGCGCVTVNYDGRNKYRCTVEDGAFLGCNTNLVAPVKLGKGSYTAAGSTITEDVPEGALAIARERQTNMEGWVLKRRS